jgi:phage gp29-like protein
MSTKTTRNKGKELPKNLIIQNTTITQVVRQSTDIGKWRDALRAAESVTNPNRTTLYDVYSEIKLDGHLVSVVGKRKAAILKKKFSFVRNGVEDLKVMEQIESPWFFLFMNDLLDTIWWGHSLFQFYKMGDWVAYSLIPRKHVKPEKGIVTKNQSDQNGIAYLLNPEFPNVLEVKYMETLGMYNIASPYVIYKRNGLGDFAEYAEDFGQPMREGIYDGYDEEVRNRLVKDLTEAGRGKVFVHQRNTQVNTIDSTSKSSSTGIFDKLIEICNAEISKLGVGNTLTTQEGTNGARSLGEVQKEGEEDLNVTDETFVLNCLNYDMTDIFAALGINTTGGKFVLMDKDTVDLEAEIAIDEKLEKIGVPLGDDYYYKKYNRPKPSNYAELKKTDTISPGIDKNKNPEKSGNTGDKSPAAMSQTFYDIYGKSNNDVGFIEKLFNFFGLPLRR